MARRYVSPKKRLEASRKVRREEEQKIKESKKDIARRKAHSERVAKELQEKKARQKRWAAARAKELQEIKDYITSLAGEKAIAGKERLQLPEWRKLRDEWKQKEKLIRQIADSGSPQSADAIHKLKTDNPTMAKWEKVADTFSSGGFYNPDPEQVFTPGHVEMENFRKAGTVAHNPGNFSVDQSEYIANNGWDRKYYIQQGDQVTSDRNWTEIKKFDDYLKGLLNSELTPDQRAKIVAIRQQYGHQGAVGIPGYRSRGNYLGNIQGEIGRLNLKQGPGMTLVDMLNADTHMVTSGGRVTLSKESLEAVKEFLNDPDLEKFVPNMPRGILDVPVLDRIKDPVRAAILENEYKTSGGIPLKEHLMFDSNRERAGRWAGVFRGDEAKIRLAFEGGLPNSFDAAHQNRVIRPDQIPTELIQYIQNQVEPEIKVALADMAREVAELDALEGRVETGQSQLDRAFKNLPEDMQKKILQKGFAHPIALAAIAGVAGISLPLMSEKGREKAVDAGLDALSWWGEKSELGQQTHMENNPAWSLSSNAYNAAIDSLNSITPNLGVEQYIPPTQGEDGTSFGGGSFTPQHGVGDVADTVLSFLEPFTLEAARVGAGILQPWFSPTESGGGGF